MVLITWYTSPYPWSRSVVLVPDWTGWLAEISTDLREVVAHQRRVYDDALYISTVTYFLSQQWALPPVLRMVDHLFRNLLLLSQSLHRYQIVLLVLYDRARRMWITCYMAASWLGVEPPFPGIVPLNITYCLSDRTFCVAWLLWYQYHCHLLLTSFLQLETVQAVRCIIEQIMYHFIALMWS